MLDLAFVVLLMGATHARARGAEDEVAAHSGRSDPDPVYFEERIQPLYAANCGTTGCHGSPGSGRLLLARPDFQGRYSLESTERNLATSLQFVEFRKPMESRLLLKPLRKKDGGLPHTGQQYDFGKESEEYRILADWIDGVELTDVPPIADAGPDKSGKRGQEIALDGTASRERRGGDLAYRWTLESRPDGSAPVLRHADAASAILKADADGAYVLSLVVDNGVRASEPSTVTVTVDSSPFVALEAEDAAIERGFDPTRDAAASGGRALAPSQGVTAESPGVATLRFTLPRAGACRVFARAASAQSGSGSTEPAGAAFGLTLQLDDQPPRDISQAPGSGYRVIELPAIAADQEKGEIGALPAAGGRALSGSVVIRDGVLSLRGEPGPGGEPARFRLDGDASSASFDLEVRWSRPDKGEAHATSFAVAFEPGAAATEPASGTTRAGIEVGRSRYSIRRGDVPAPTVLAEKRSPFRPDGTERIRVDVREGKLFLQTAEGQVLESALPIAAGPLAATLEATGEFEVVRGTTAIGTGTPRAITFDSLGADAAPQGWLAAGDHAITLRTTDPHAPRLDQVFLAPAGVAAGKGLERAREARALYLDLLGRTPTPIERMMALSIPRERLAASLASSLEFHENLYQLELYYFLLLDNFHPRTPQLEALPSRLANGETDLRDATREIVISQYFNARNPGNDTFVTVILEQLLGITVQDDVKLLEAGKRMYDGYKSTVFGKSGASQSDLVGIVLDQPQYATRLLGRHYERLLGSPPRRPDLEAWAERFRSDPKTYESIVLEWLASDAYAAAQRTPRRKDDFMWVRGTFVDLLQRKPTFEEFRNFRNAVQALADSTPLRSVLSKVILDSGQVALPAKSGLDSRAFVVDLFDRLLARAPSAAEVAAFERALAEQAVEPRTIVQAILSSAEYQHY